MEKRWKVVVAFVGIFLLGAVTGALLMLRYAPQHHFTTIVTSPAPSSTPTTANTTASASAPTETTPGTTVPGPATTNVAASQLRPAPEQLGPQLFRKITNQLNLTPQQRQKIRPIELRATEELNRLRRDTVHSTQVLIDRNEDEIREILTPEQAAKFDVLVSQQRDRIEKFVADQQRRQREQREKMMQSRGGVMATPAASGAKTAADEKKE